MSILIGILIVLAIADALGFLFWYVCSWPRSQVLGPALVRGPAGSRKVALTFGDGPLPPYTQQILDILRSSNAKATFFVCGKDAERHPEILRRICAEGHTIGNHTWSQSKKKREVRKHLRAGHSLYRKKIYRKALQEFGKAIELDPDNYRAYFWRGRVHIKTNHLKEATSDFQKVIDLKPDYAEAYDNLGWIHLKLEEYDRSIDYLSRSLELKPKDGWTHYTRGRSYYKKNDLQKARKDMKVSCNLGYTNGCQAYKEYREKRNASDSSNAKSK